MFLPYSKWALGDMILHGGGAQFASTDVYKNSCYATWMAKLGLHCKYLQGYMGLLQGKWGTWIYIYRGLLGMR